MALLRAGSLALNIKVQGASWMFGNETWQLIPFHHSNFFCNNCFVPWPLLWMLAHLLPRRVFYYHGVVPVEGDRHHAGELPASLHPQVPAQTLLAAQLLQAHLVNSERIHVCDHTRVKGGLFPVILLLWTAIRNRWDGLVCPRWKKQCYFALCLKTNWWTTGAPPLIW